MRSKTYESDTLGILLAGMQEGVKPVYMKCAHNYYMIKRIVDMGDFYMLESPEEEGIVALDDEDV
jgi:hypothetical protein